MTGKLNPIALTKFPQGGIRELLALAIPLFIISFSSCLLGFIEKVWFSSHSLETLEAAYSAVNVLRIFQLPCIALVTMAQAYVGYYNGSQEKTSIGCCIWQMIWFSIFSMMIIIPLSFCTHHLFFKGIKVEPIILPYFFMLAFSNFLFPVGAALSSFYLGRGKTTFVTLATLLTYVLNLGLDFAFIFGVSPWIPSLGLKGAAIATMISQGTLCLVLLTLFLNKFNRENYHTHRWAFQPQAFFRYISPALPRAFGRLILLAVWASNAYVMASKSGDYSLVLSIGGTLSLFLSFIGDGFLQALIVLVSNALGLKNYTLIKKSIYGGLIFSLIVSLVLAVPLLFFPDRVLSFFSLEKTPPSSVYNCLKWVWLNTVLYILNTIPMSILLSSKDTIFTFSLTFTTWITSFLPIYFCINYLRFSPDKFWLLTCTSMILSLIVYYWRISYKRWLQPTGPSALLSSFPTTNKPRI